MICAHSHPLGPLGRRDTGGMSVYIRETARALADLGHRVDIFVGEGEAGEKGPSSSLLFPRVRTWSVPKPQNGAASFRHFSDIASRFADALCARSARSENGYHVIFSHYWLSALAGLEAARRLRVPHAVMFHTLAILKKRAHPGSEDSPCRLCAERRAAGRSDRIITATARERDVLCESYGVPPGRIQVVSCGVNETLFRPLNRKACRRRWNLPLGEPVFLFVGRFDPIKGLDRLLEATALLPPTVLMRLLVVGGDPEPEDRLFLRYREMCRRLKIEDRVRFLGRIPHERLPEVYSAADALVVPSYYESFCLAALEALACGVPVIGPPVGVLEELAPLETGILTKDNSAESLARGLRLVVESPHRIPPDRLRRTALRYSWGKAARELARLFQQTSAERRSFSDLAHESPMTTEAGARAESSFLYECRPPGCVVPMLGKRHS